MARDAAMDAMRAIAVRVDALREYSATEPVTHLVGLLEALKTSYMHDLVDVTPDQLQAKQGALRQVMALLYCIEAPSASTPKI